MKTIFQYLFLICLPVVGVWLLLQAGKTLEAPVSVGGRWLITAVDSSADCLDVAHPLAGDVLIISQSGPHLNLVLAGDITTILTGNIEATQLTARTFEPAAVTFAGNADRQSEPDVLTGVVGVNNCSMAVTAVRQATLPTTTEIH